MSGGYIAVFVLHCHRRFLQSFRLFLSLCQVGTKLCFACAYIICRLNRQRGNCFKASVCIFEYKINLCSEQNPYAFCILGIYIYVAPPRTSFQYDFANDKKEKATLTKSEDCFQNNIHTHFCIRNLRIFQTGYSILPVPEKSVFPPWR